MKTGKKPKNKHWKFLRKVFRQLAVAKALVPTDSKSHGEDVAINYGENVLWTDQHIPYESGSGPSMTDSTSGRNHVVVKEGHDSFHDDHHEQINPPQHEANPVSAPSNPYLSDQRPLRKSQEGSSKSMSSSSTDCHQDDVQQLQGSSYRRSGKIDLKETTASVLTSTTPSKDDTSTIRLINFAVQQKLLLSQRRHVFLEQTTVEEAFICKALGMDNRFGMCMRHPNQPITTNTRGLLMGTALYRVQTCLICESESQAMGTMGPDGHLIRRHVPAMGDVIQQVQQLQLNKHEWDKRTKLLGGSPSSADWEISSHSDKSSETNTIRTSDERLPNARELFNAENGMTSGSLLDVESSTGPLQNGESKDTMLSLASSVHYTEDEWADQVRRRVIQVRSWEDRFAIKYHPVFCRYFKMVKLGVPLEAVKSSLEMDGYHPSIMDLNASQSLKLQLNKLSPDAVENLRTMGALDEMAENEKDEIELSIPETVQKVLLSLRQRRLNQVYAASTLWDEMSLRRREEEERLGVGFDSKADPMTEKPESLPNITSIPEIENHSAEKGDGDLSRSDGLVAVALEVERSHRKLSREIPPEPADELSDTSHTKGNDEKVGELSPHPTRRETRTSLDDHTRSFREDRAKNLDAMLEWRMLRPSSLRASSATHDDTNQDHHNKGPLLAGHGPSLATGTVESELGELSGEHGKSVGKGNERQEWKDSTNIANETELHRIDERSEMATTTADPVSSEYRSPTQREKTGTMVPSPQPEGKDNKQGSIITASVSNGRRVEKQSCAPQVNQKRSSVGVSQLTQSVAIPLVDTRIEVHDSNPSRPERKPSFPLDVAPEDRVRHSIVQAVSPVRISETAQSTGKPNNYGKDLHFMKNFVNRKPTATHAKAGEENESLGVKNEFLIKQTKGKHDASDLMPVASQKSNRNAGRRNIDTSKKESRKRERLANQEHPPLQDVILSENDSVDHSKLLRELELLIQRTPSTRKQEKIARNDPFFHAITHRNHDGLTNGATSVLTDDVGGSLDETIETEAIAASGQESLTSVASIESLENPCLIEEVTGTIFPPNTLAESKSPPVSVRDRATQCSLESISPNVVSKKQFAVLKTELDSARTSLEMKDKAILDLKRELERKDKTIARLEQRIESLEDRSKATGRVLESATMQAKIDEARKRQTAIREKFMSPHRPMLNATISASGMDFAALALSPADRSRRLSQSRLYNKRAGGDRTEKKGGARRGDLLDAARGSSRSLDSGLPGSMTDLNSDDDDTVNSRQRNEDIRVSKSHCDGDENAKKLIISLFDSWSAQQFRPADSYSPKSPTARTARRAKVSPRRGITHVEEKVLGPIEREEWDVGEEKESLDRIR